MWTYSRSFTGSSSSVKESCRVGTTPMCARSSSPGIRANGTGSARDVDALRVDLGRERRQAVAILAGAADPQLHVAAPSRAAGPTARISVSTPKRGAKPPW